MGRSQERGLPPALSYGTSAKSREGAEMSFRSTPAPERGFGLIEPDAARVARPVPRRGGPSNGFLLSYKWFT
jgi:hypothetical protein